MKKRKILPIFLTLALMTGIVPAQAAELPAPEGLTITWYTDYEGLMRRYGTDRMLLVKDGKSGLFGLDGTKYTDCVFDAFGTFNGSGVAPACLNGKWGMVDLDGKTVVDFTYDGQYEAELAGETYPVFQGKDGKDAPPYALFSLDGTQLTEYKYQYHDRFVNGFAMVTADGEGWGYVNTQGVEITPFKYRDYPLNTAKYPGDDMTAYGTFDAAGFAMVCTDEGFNVINSQGRELLETPTELRPWRAGDGTWGYIDRASGKVGFIDGEGTVVVQPQYDDPGKDPKGFQQIIYRNSGVAEEWKYHEGLLRFQAQENGPWGFQDEAGELAVPAVFDAAGYFDRGYASVKSGDTFGLLKNPLLGQDKPEETTKPEPSIRFTDVPAGSWFEQGVMTCAQNGIMVGVSESEFAPNANLTEAECTMLAYRLYDKAHGGDGSVMKRPEKYRYIKLTTDDGLFVHEGEGGDRSKWTATHPTFAGGGLYLCPQNIEGSIPGLEQENKAAATVAIDGVEYKGHLERFYEGHMRPWILAFVAETPEENDLVARAATASEPGHWWSDLGYTIEQKDLRLLFPSYYLDDDEAQRYVFADLLGHAVELPKTLEITAIPDVRAWSEEYEGTYTNEIWKLYEAGIVGGVDEYGTFEATKTLTRAEAAVMVARVLDESQRLKTPPKPMPKDGEGYTLTYLMDGAVDSNFYQDTYPYFFVQDREGDSGSQVKRLGFLKLDGTFTPWPEGMDSTALTRYGGDKMFWTVDSGTVMEDGRAQYVKGVTNDRLEWIIQPQYEELWPREGGFCAATWDGRYLLLDETGREVEEVGSWDELPEMPFWTGYYEYWNDWQNWGGLWSGNEAFYYRWPDGAPATERFDWCGKIGPDGKGFVQKDGKIYRIEFTQPEGETVTQAALDRVTIEGIKIGIPFEDLPQDLRAALQSQGEPYDSGVFNPGEEIGRRYTAPGIEVITSTATEKVLKRALEGQDKEYLLENYGSEDWQTVYEREKGREYVDTVILTGDNYHMVSGLKVGDSGARVRELGYPLRGETYGGTVGFDGATTVYMGNDVVERIEVYDCLGRRIGPFYDP